MPIYHEARGHIGEYTYLTKKRKAEDAHEEFAKLVLNEGQLLIENLGKINKLY